MSIIEQAARPVKRTWQTEVTGLMTSLGYSAAVIAAMLAHLPVAGRAGGCPGVHLSDIPVITSVYVDMR